MKKKIEYRYILYLFCIFIYCNCNLLSQLLSITVPDSSKIKLMIADVRISPSAPEINNLKVEAAINLAAEMSEKYTLIPENIKDSISNIVFKEQKNLTILTLANLLKADKMLFLKINRLVNVIRVDITVLDCRDTTDKKYGIGYSLVHYFDNITGKPLSDPFLLEAIQRAFACAIRDTLLYNKLPSKYRVFPAPSLVIGGIEFLDDDKLPEMLLFKNKVVVSYDLCESLFEEISKSDKFVSYDISTRDTMYAMAKFYYVENYNPPNQIELKILSLFEIEYYLTGLYKRTKEGAYLELQLCKIENQMLRLINSVNGTHQNDNIEELRSLAKLLIKKLLEFKYY